jgi:hypothetical protein
MKFIELQEAFELEINVLDDAFKKPKSSDTEWWLNRGLEKFWKTRYSGINYKQKGFEQNQKRIDDLRTLVTEKLYTDDIVTASKSQYNVTLPDNYVVLLGDTAGIAPADGAINDCWETDEDGEYVVKTADTIEATIETVDRQLENSLSEHHLRYCKAKPIKLLYGNHIQLYTDGNYKVAKYNILYLRRPEYIDIHSNPFDEYTDMPEHTHAEIVKIAAQMYLENQANPRIQTHDAEVSTME